MKSKRCLVMMAIMGTMISVHAIDQEVEKPVAIKDAPAEVQQAISTFISLLPEGAKLEQLKEEKENEGTVYEAEIEVPGGAEFEVEFNAKGKILEVETEEERDSKEDGEKADAK